MEIIMKKQSWRVWKGIWKGREKR